VGGTLYDARGLEQITVLLGEMADLYVICAGWLYDDVARQFIEHEKVDYRGVVTPQEALLLAGQCDAVLALYNPVNANMIMASPNKIYDAMCVGRPVIINSETKISDWVVSFKVGYSCPYSDIDGLRRIIESIEENKPNAELRSREIRERFEAGYSWKTAESKLFGAYRKISGSE